MNRKNRKENDRLAFWQRRLGHAENEYSAESGQMKRREDIYRGDRYIDRMVEGDRTKKTPQVRNIASELIESVVDSTIPQPKVTAVRPEDTELAAKIEEMLKCEIDRLPFEKLNDMMERTVPVQGGGYFLCEWDQNQICHDYIGDVTVSLIHPSRIIPEPGVYTSLADMRYFFVKTEMTAEAVRSRYGEEALPENEYTDDDEMLTVWSAYYREDDDIGLFVFTGDNILLDDRRRFRRKKRVCRKCGGEVTGMARPLIHRAENGIKPDSRERKDREDICPFCGSRAISSGPAEYETAETPFLAAGGTLPVSVGDKIPFYTPDRYPVVLQKNISVHGQLLGESDIDKIGGQQNTLKRISAKINEKLIKSGSYMTIPARASIRTDSEELKVIRINNPADKAMISVFNMEPDISADLAWYERVYEEARQIIGVTDSFQGRKDPTATSGTAKQISVERSAGRLESKRILKNAAYAELYEQIFRLKLAYADGERPIVVRGGGGERYSTFNRYDFLCRDESGEYYWNDRFLFSTDTAYSDAPNRSELWEMAKTDYLSGTYGPVGSDEALYRYWSRMEELRYPGAAAMRKGAEII